MKSLTAGLILVLYSSVAWPQGGPPLLTDDPDTPADGHWEINLAAGMLKQSQRTTFEIPFIDLNYGYGNRVQLKAETAFLSTSEKSGGFGTSIFGVKWRYFECEH